MNGHQICNSSYRGREWVSREPIFFSNLGLRVPSWALQLEPFVWEKIPLACFMNLPCWFWNISYLWGMKYDLESARVHWEFFENKSKEKKRIRFVGKIALNWNLSKKLSPSFLVIHFRSRWQVFVRVLLARLENWRGNLSCHLIQWRKNRTEQTGKRACDRISLNVF